MNFDHSFHSRQHDHRHGHHHPLQPTEGRPSSAAMNSNKVEVVPTAELRQAVRQLQSAIDAGSAARGVVHAASWRFPAACAAEVSVEAVLDRYRVEVPDPRHTAAARSALLELVVDRAVLLAESTLHHLDVDLPGDSDALDAGNDALDASTDPTTSGGDDATGPAPGGGIATITRLCEAALRLQSSREDMYLSLENKDAALDQMDAEVDRLATLVDRGTTTTQPPAAAAARSRCPVVTTAVAVVQTDPEDRPRSLAKDKDDDALRRAVAAVREQIELLGLVDLAAVAPPGRSPVLCTELCAGYLRSHAGHLATLAKLRDQWHHERDEATEAARRANATVAEQGTAIDGLRWDIEQQGKLHQSQVLEMGAHATEELAAATEQHGAELAALRAEHARSVTMLATERDANMTALQVRHEATLNEARAVGSDSGIRIAALTKELLEITDGQRERDEQCEQKVTEANKAVREANEWARGLQSELETKCKAETAARQCAEEATRAMAALQTTVDQLNADLAREKQSRTEDQAVSSVLKGELAAMTDDANEHKRQETMLSANLEKLTTDLESERTQRSSAEKTAKEAKAELEEVIDQRDAAEKWLDRAGEERVRLLNRVAQLEPWAPEGWKPIDQVAETVGSPTGMAGRPVSAVAVRSVATPKAARTSSPKPPPAAAPTPPAGRRKMASTTGRASSVSLPSLQVPGSPQMGSKNDRKAAIKKYLAARKDGT